jgi:hypothetical protein
VRPEQRRLARVVLFTFGVACLFIGAVGGPFPVTFLGGLLIGINVEPAVRLIRGRP